MSAARALQQIPYGVLRSAASPGSVGSAGLEVARSGLLIAVSSRPPFSCRSSEDLGSRCAERDGRSSQKFGFQAFSKYRANLSFGVFKDINSLAIGEIRTLQIFANIYSAGMWDINGLSLKKGWKFIFLESLEDSTRAYSSRPSTFLSTSVCKDGAERLKCPENVSAKEKRAPTATRYRERSDAINRS